MLGVGTIHIQTAGYSGQQGRKAELKMNGIKETEKIRDIIIGHIGHYRRSYEERKDIKAEKFEEKRDLSDALIILKNISDELINISKKVEK